MNNDKILFSETQRFRQIWVWLLLICINALVLTGLIQQVFLGHQFGDKPAPNTTLWVATAIVFSITALFIFIRLDTKITTHGIYVRFFPIQPRFAFYSWDNINQIFVREYNPLGEYGGWGLRGFGYNRALNISGDKGIQISMTDGDQLLIGTNKPDEAMQALKQTGQLTEK